MTDISEAQYKVGGISLNDYLKIKDSVAPVPAGRPIRPISQEPRRCPIFASYWVTNRCPPTTTSRAHSITSL